MIEAMLFASAEPLTTRDMAERMPHGSDPAEALVHLRKRYEGRGVRVVKVGDAWAIRTAPDLGYLMSRETVETRKLSRAAIETLAIIAYHQPVTRAEIEEIRGVAVSKGTLDLLFELRWIRPRGRRRTPGRPVTYGTTQKFLEYFSLASIGDLPGMSDLKAAGLLDARLPPDFVVPDPGRVEQPELIEDPLDDEEAHAFHVDFMEGDGDGPDAAS